MSGTAEIKKHIYAHKPDRLEVVCLTADNFQAVGFWLGATKTTVTYEEGKLPTYRFSFDTPTGGGAFQQPVEVRQGHFVTRGLGGYVNTIEDLATLAERYEKVAEEAHTQGE